MTILCALIFFINDALTCKSCGFIFTHVNFSFYRNTGEAGVFQLYEPNTGLYTPDSQFYWSNTNCTHAPPVCTCLQICVREKRVNL